MTMWLTGMMGSGKTSAGIKAAASLGVAFHDTDAEVAHENGRTIRELWEALGEDGFRELERAAVSRLAGADAIVATGGGVVTDARNREAMAGSGTVIWLQAPAEILLTRVGGDTGRPLLAAAGDPLVVLRDLAAERSGWYGSFADHVIDTSDLTVDEVALEIEALWKG